MYGGNISDCQMSGTIPSFTDRLNIIDMSNARQSERLMMNEGGIPSGPAPLLTSKDFKMFSVSSVLVSMEYIFLNDGYVSSWFTGVATSE